MIICDPHFCGSTLFFGGWLLLLNTFANRQEFASENPFQSFQSNIDETCQPSLSQFFLVSLSASSFFLFHAGNPSFPDTGGFNPPLFQPGLPDGLISCTQAPARTLIGISDPSPESPRSHNPVLFSTCHVHHQNTESNMSMILIYYIYTCCMKLPEGDYQVLQHVYEARNVRAGRDHKGPMVRHSPSYTWLYLGTW